MGRVVIPGFRKIETSGGGEGGTTNYNDLTNKPSINNVPLVGNLKTLDLKLTDKTLTEEGVPAEAKTVGTKLEEHSTSLTALSEQLGNHTVKSDVPENAVFTDTVYDDTEVKESIEELDSNLGELAEGYYGKDITYPKSSGHWSYSNGKFYNNITDTRDNLQLAIQFYNSSGVYISQEFQNILNVGVYNIEFETPSNTAFIRFKHNGKSKDLNYTDNLCDVLPNTKYVAILNVSGTNPKVNSGIAFSMIIKKFISSVSSISDSLDALRYGEVAGGKNLLNPDKTIIGELSEGIVLSGEHYISDYISIKSDTSYSISNCTQDTNEIAWYTSDKTYISRSFGTPVISPSNASYVRIEYIGNINAQIEEGSVATEYEPYFPSNKMLAEEKADKTETTVNLLNLTLQTTTLNGITCTNNGDGTYTLNGTATANFSEYITTLFNLSQNKSYKLLGTPIGGSVQKYSITLLSEDFSDYVDDIGEGVIITPKKSSYLARLNIIKGTTVNNLVFKPILTTNLNATIDDFVGYTGSTGSLNGDVADIRKDIKTLENYNTTETVIGKWDDYTLCRKVISGNHSITAGKEFSFLVDNITSDEGVVMEIKNIRGRAKGSIISEGNKDVDGVMTVGSYCNANYYCSCFMPGRSPESISLLGKFGNSVNYVEVELCVEYTVERI